MATQATVSRFPTEFVQEPAVHKLRFHEHKKLPPHRLPFVDRVPGKLGLSFWTVPKTGGYFGGNETGGTLARIYLKHLKEHDLSFGGSYLQIMVLDMFGCKSGVSPEQDVLRGQVAGLFIELERWLVSAVKYLEDRLETECDKDLLEAANNGLNFDNEAYMASLYD
ncbi:MAG: hypothetical protein AB2697_22145 [Candidatus Thiodiazotropha endolucinida]|nr:hypothetical protein [Candidatus Thiodiazotropha sp. (ex Lucina pensylvanica)]